MCHNRTNNRKINRLHERCLRIIYNDKQSSFIELLEKDNFVSIHQRNLQVLAIEMFKVSNGLSPVLLNDIFKRRGEETYNLRKHSQFYRLKVNSEYNGTESVSFLGPIIWDLVPNELKDTGDLAAFKKQSKSGHRRNVLVGFVKFILTMLVLFKKRGSCRIFPVQKLLYRINDFYVLFYFTVIFFVRNLSFYLLSLYIKCFMFNSFVFFF